MNETTFDKYIATARHILWTERQMWGDTLEDFAYECYRRKTASGRNVFLRNLIGLAEYFRFAQDAVRRIGRAELRNRRRTPRELERWMAKTKVPKQPRFIARGPDPNTNIMRNRAIMIAVLVLSRKDLTPTRNITQGKIDYLECTFLGGSACDAVGLAVKRVYNDDLDYKTIERIWFEGKLMGISLKSPASFIFKLSSHMRYHRPTPTRLSDKKKENRADDR